MNITDPDSHYMKTREGFVQGYNQAVVNEQQIVLAAEITTSTVDWSQLDLMVSAVAELEHAGVSDLMATHNLAKLHRHHLASVRA